MGKHTEGPWSVGRAESDGTYLVGGTRTVAIVDLVNGRNNANLIAAAPDLLAALKSVEWAGQSEDGEGSLVPVCPYCDAVEDDGHYDHCQLAAAIAKAEGATDAKAQGLQGVRRADEEAGQGATEAEAKVETQET